LRCSLFNTLPNKTVIDGNVG